MNKEIENSLWTEKYRAKSTKQMILTSGNRRFFNSIIKNGVLPNLLIYSPRPGNGKSTLAKAICNDLEIEDVLYCNASESANIDFLRNDISDFAKTWSLDGKPKVVILDDMGGTSHAFQEALKVFSEQYSKSCRFIITTNNLAKIIEPLRSRFKEVDFNMERKEIKDELAPNIKKLLMGILKKEKVEFSPDSLDQLIDKSFPDVRQMIKSLQCEFIENGLISENVVRFATVDAEFYNLILEKKFTSARRYVIENQLPIGEVYSKLYREFVPMISEKMKQAEVILIIEEYAFKHVGAFDPEIFLAACILRIISALQ